MLSSLRFFTATALGLAIAAALPLSFAPVASAQTNDTSVPINMISLDAPNPHTRMRHGTLIVPNHDTTRSAYGGRLRYYDVHLAKMLEVSHQYYCDRPYEAGLERIMEWDYYAASGDVYMGTFYFPCTLVEQAVEKYGLGRAEITELQLPSGDRVVTTVPVLGLHGPKIDDFMSWVQMLRPEHLF